MTTAALKSAKSGFNSWTLRLFTLLVWLLVGLCAAYWAFKFTTTKTIEAATAQPAASVAADSKAIAKFLGATDNIAVKPINTAASTKFLLFGLAKTDAGQGYALIALDGKPAKPYRVGSLVADDLLLKSISTTGVILAKSLTSPDGVTLELPERKTINNPAMNNLAIAPHPNTAPAPQARFPVIPPSNATAAAPLPMSAAPAPAAQPNAAAAISRFAPRASADGAAPAMPTAAVTATVGEK